MNLKELELKVPMSQVVYVGLTGSRQYGYDTDKSDIDLVCVYTPTYSDFFLNKDTKTSKTFGEIDGIVTDIDYIPIHEFSERLINGDPQLVPFLFSTSYNTVHTSELWEGFFIPNRYRFVTQRYIDRCASIVKHAIRNYEKYIPTSVKGNNDFIHWLRWGWYATQLSNYDERIHPLTDNIISIIKELKTSTDKHKNLPHVYQSIMNILSNEKITPSGVSINEILNAILKYPTVTKQEGCDCGNCEFTRKHGGYMTCLKKIRKM